MKKLLLAIGVFALIAATPLYAASPIGPAMDGETGIMRVISARSLPATGLMMGINGLYFWSNDLLNTESDVNQRLEERTNLTYGATDWLELFINATSAAQTIKYTSANDTMLFQTLGDLTGGFKLSYLVTPGFAFGFDAFGQLLTDANQLGYKLSASNYGARLLWTIDLDAAENIPFRFHVNLGYKVDNSRYLLPAPNYTWTGASVDSIYATGLTRTEEEYALGIYHDNQILGAIGVEFPGTYLTPFIEYYTNQLINNHSITGHSLSLKYDQSPQYITPGFRFTPEKGVAVDIAADIGLTKQESVQTSNGPVNVRAVPLWSVIVGASYTILPGAMVIIQRVQAPPPQQNGVVGGVVLDEQTRQPISHAILSFPGTNLSDIITNRTNGAFTSCQINPGTVKIEVSKDGYQPKVLEAQVLTGQTTNVDVLMKKLVEIGAIAGMVTDTTGKPLAAVLTFNNTTLPPGATDPRTGFYFVKLPPGIYSVTVAAQGYISRTFTVPIKNNVKTVVNITLEQHHAAAAPPPPAPITAPVIMQKKPRVILEKAKKKIVITEAIHFQTGRATILPESYSLLDEIVQVLKDNPDISIRIEGYTDNVGSPSYNLRLSQARAESVMKYFIQEGLSPDRVQAKGYGDMLPIASNKTAQGRAKNRRVEFTIIKE